MSEHLVQSGDRGAVAERKVIIHWLKTCWFSDKVDPDLIAERIAKGDHLVLKQTTFVMDKELPDQVDQAVQREVDKIQDFIQQTQPSVGLKRDDGKSRWDLLPWKAVGEVVKVLTFGAKKYRAWNWLHVEDARNRYFAAAMRHAVAYRAGERDDPESGLPHLAHVACCVLFMLGLDVGEKETSW